MAQDFPAKERDPEIKPLGADSPNTTENKLFMRQTGLDYFGARYYSSGLSVWLSVDALAGKYPALSPYMYTAGNPVNMIDPDGNWPKWVHNRIINIAFKGILTKEHIKILQKASAYTDNKKGAQFPKNSYQHGMSSPYQTPEEAKMQADNFIKNKFEKYVENGDLSVLGEGMHTIMDRTSPAHEGEQVWNGTKGVKNLIKGFVHFLKELNVFRKDENRVDKAASIIRAYYFSAQKEREKSVDKQVFQKANNGSGLGGKEKNINIEKRIEKSLKA